MSRISKLGLGIVAFEGTEHIKNITYELRDLCDYIVVCLQKISYDGEHCISQFDIDECEHLKSCGLIDNIIWFESKTDYSNVAEQKSVPRRIETDKRNYILQDLEQHGMTHGMVIDSDEFYDHDDFMLARKMFDSNDEMKVSYCEYVNYYRDYQHLLIWPFRSYVPFITEIQYRFSFDNGSFDRPSDPTRRYLIPERGKYHIFPYRTVKMHHLSWIRINIERKIDAWSAKKYFENVQDLRKKILERYYGYNDGQNAFITFNVPNFEVSVNKLPRQYINPKYLLHEQAKPYNGYNR